MISSATARAKKDATSVRALSGMFRCITTGKKGGGGMRVRGQQMKKTPPSSSMRPGRNEPIKTPGKK